MNILSFHSCTRCPGLSSLLPFECASSLCCGPSLPGDCFFVFTAFFWHSFFLLFLNADAALCSGLHGHVAADSVSCMALVMFRMSSDVPRCHLLFR